MSADPTGHDASRPCPFERRGDIARGPVGPGRVGTSHEPRGPMRTWIGGRRCAPRSREEACTVQRRRGLHVWGRHGLVSVRRQTRGTARDCPASDGGDDVGPLASAACSRVAAHGITSRLEAWASGRHAALNGSSSPRGRAHETRGNHPSCRQGESPSVDRATATRRRLDGPLPSHAA